MLTRLAVAASLVVEHVGAYADLVLCDAEDARREAGRRLWIGALMAMAMVFAIAMACLLLIAIAWNTVGRLFTIGGLLCLFSAAAYLAYRRLCGMSVQRVPLFARTAREWDKDRLLLAKMLTGIDKASDAGDER